MKRIRMLAGIIRLTLVASVVCSLQMQTDNIPLASRIQLLEPLLGSKFKINMKAVEGKFGLPQTEISITWELTEKGEYIGEYSTGALVRLSLQTLQSNEEVKVKAFSDGKLYEKSWTSVNRITK
jgi:hypothetical protein